MRTRIVPDIWLFIFAVSATLIGLLFIFDAGYARSIQETGSMIPAEFTTQIRLLLVAMGGTSSADTYRSISSSDPQVGFGLFRSLGSDWSM